MCISFLVISQRQKCFHWRLCRKMHAAYRNYGQRGVPWTSQRLLWMTCICIAIFGTASLTKRTWTRFQTSPMVISMDRNKFVWNTSFPSLTVCPHKRIDEIKLDEYMKCVTVFYFYFLLIPFHADNVQYIQCENIKIENSFNSFNSLSVNLFGGSLTKFKIKK